MKRFAQVAVVVVLSLFILGIRPAQQRSTLQLWDAAALGLAGAITADNKFGQDADLDTVEGSIWTVHDLPTNAAGPLRCFDNMGTTPAPLYISSDHENDAGLVVTVNALDADYNAISIDATLGAASASGTLFAQIGTADLIRVNRAFATTADLTGNVYIGLDDIDGGTDGIPDTPATDIIAGITAGENQTLQSCYTVPNDFRILVAQFCVSNVANTGAAAFRFRSGFEGSAMRTRELLTLTAGRYKCTPKKPPVFYPEKTDIELTGDSTNNNAIVSGTFDFLIVPNGMR